MEILIWRIKYTIIAVLLLLLLFSNRGVTQTISTEGRDFWIGFMNNWDQSSGNPIILEIYLSARDSTKAVLDIPLSESWGPLEVDIYPERATRVQIPTSVAMAVGSGLIQDIGIHILSEANISVYAMNKRQFSADISVILPAISLGKNYLATAHWEPGNRNEGANSQAEILILSIADSTEIVIDPSGDLVNGNRAHQPFSIFLNRGQVYQIQSFEDLTGTHIYSVENNDNSCNNFAVFSGNRYTKVGQCDHPDGHDHLYAQMYPTNTWGKSFITIPFASRSGGDFFKILASEDNTNVELNGNAYILNMGEVREVTYDNIGEIEASKPISVVQFSRSQACDNSTSDPFMIVVSPKEQLLEQVTFNAPPGNNLDNYFMNVVAKTEGLSQVFLDDSSIGSFFGLVPFDNSYSFAQVPINEGNHTLKSNSGFIAYVYGYGFNESFGFATGASLENLLVNIDISDIQGNPLGSDEICRFTEVLFTAETQDNFSEFFWDFGDGTTAVSDTSSIVHLYADIGDYLVQLVASMGSATCALGGSETSFKLVSVIKPEIEIMGPRSVCPNTLDVLYKVEGETGNQYYWESNGGMITSANNLDSILVDWGATNNMADVSVFPIDRFGCLGDTSYHKVKINVQLEPEAPFGPDSLCSSEITDLGYFAYQTTGSVYSWGIDNGTISDGQGTSDIRLSWDTFGNGHLWFEQTSSLDSVCAGVSDTMYVFIERNPPDYAAMNLSAESLNIGQVLYASMEADSIYQWVNWNVPGLVKMDTAVINESFQWQFDCQGAYEIEALLFDTLGLCKASTFISRPVVIKPPELEVINVTHDLMMDSTLNINFEMENMQDFPKAVSISRRDHFPETGTWAELGLISVNQTSFVDAIIPTGIESFSYKILWNEDCGAGLESNPHNSILLNGSLVEEMELSWNEYNSWNGGVSAYEIWKDIDNGGYQLINSQQKLEYDYKYKSEGFQICFRIRALEFGGNNSESWSNEVCEQFFPELKPYNVFSPNKDQWNQYFIIEGVHMYPNSQLIIVNRYGRTLFEKIGYKNDWQGTSLGGDQLPAGVYYWTLQLNEPRVDVEYIRGEVSILY